MSKSLDSNEGFLLWVTLCQSGLPQPLLGLSDDGIEMRQVRHLATRAGLPQSLEDVLSLSQDIPQCGLVQSLAHYLFTALDTGVISLAWLMVV